MIYVDNDWYSNFNNSVKANDNKSMASMLADAISTVTATTRPELLDLLSKAEVEIANEPSNEQINDAIVQNIGSNNKLRVGIAYLIAKDKGILSPTKKQHSRVEGTEKDIERELDGKKPKKQRRKIDWSKTADTVSAIASSISAITDSLAQRQNGQNQFKQDLNTLTNNKSPEYSGGNNDINNVPKVPTPPKSKKWLWILLGVGVLGTVAIVGHKKGWFKKNTP